MWRDRLETRIAVVLLSIAPLVGSAPGNAALAADPASPAVSDTPLGSRPLSPGPGQSSPRVVIVDGTLVIDGTTRDDRILISATTRRDTVRVAIGGWNAGRYGPVDHIVVNAGDGNDTVLVSPAVTLPVRINGGRGNDVLRGGSGSDVVMGEEGDDLLIGSDGRDALDTGPGRDRLIALWPMGEIHVGAAAEGYVLRILSTAYTLRPLHAEPDRGSRGAARKAGPIIVGAADLVHEHVADFLKASYRAGHAITLTGPHAAEAEQLRLLLGHSSGVNWDASIARVELVAFRRATRPDGRLHESVTTVFPRAAVELPPDQARHGRRKADARTIAWLSGVFSGTPVVPDPAPRDNGPVQNLLALADSYQSSAIQSDDAGNSVQAVNSLWSVRSFQNQSDLYYVLQELDVEWGGQFPQDLKGWESFLTSFQRFQGASIIQPSPQTTMETTTETASVGYTFGGSAGWNQLQGFNALGSGSMTITNSKTTTIPPIQIANTTDFPSATAAWTYTVNELPSDPESNTFFESWIWEVPWGLYGDLNALPYSVTGGLTFGPLDDPDYELFIPQINVSVPFPFGKVFSIQPPVVTSVSPTCVVDGDKFTIEGTGLYPSLVTGVLIDGEPLDATQFSTVSDTEITVVAPDMFGFFLPVVVQTTQGVSNDDVTVAIWPVCFSGAEAALGP